MKLLLRVEEKGYGTSVMHKTAQARAQGMEVPEAHACAFDELQHGTTPEYWRGNPTEGEPRHFIFIAILLRIDYFACSINGRIGMKILCIFLLGLCCQAAWGQELLPLTQIKPGMRGVGRTVFSGYQPEEFEVEAVDVVRDFYPRRNLILVRLRGSKAEFTGVAAGMSGSPIYFDGKLAGALSYSVGVFMKEPLAGVTPIHEMMEIFDREAARAQELAAAPRVLSEGKFLEMALGLREITWENFAPPGLAQHGSAGVALRPLALPLSFSGIQPELLSEVETVLRPAGLLAISGGRAENDSVTVNDFVPGAAIGALVVSGDLSIEAIGTLTYRDDKKVLAFGHPFLSSGPINIPISLAKILTVVPSEYSAYKMGASALRMGALRQDRTTGIYGEIGAVPRMVPMRMRYTDETGRETRFTFEFTDERSLSTIMPLFLRVVLMNALQSARLATGENSLNVTGELRFQDGQKVKLDNFYAGITPLPGVGYLNGTAQSTGEIAATFGAVMTSRFPPAPLAEIEVNFASLPGWRSAAIEQVWVDRNTVQPGDTVTVWARVQAYRGGKALLKQKLIVPRSASGQFLSIVAGGSRELAQIDQRTLPGRFVANTFTQLAALLNAKRRNDSVYFQLRAPDRGLVVEGEELASLPPTAYAIMQSQTAKGNAFPARERVLSEASQQVKIPEPSARPVEPSRPYAVSGSQTIRLRLR